MTHDGTARVARSDGAYAVRGKDDPDTGRATRPAVPVMNCSDPSLLRDLGHIASVGVWETVGYVASSLVLAAFTMRDMIALRILAIASNIAFNAYGLALHLTLIWILHVLLLPMNGYRLVQALRCGRADNPLECMDRMGERRARAATH